MAVHWAPNNGPPFCAQQWAPNMAAPWLPTSRLGGRPSSGGHSASTWLHVRPPSPSIVAPRLGPPPSTITVPVRPTLAVRGFHFLDPVQLHYAVRWPSKLRQPIGTPRAFWPSTSCVVGDQFRPHFGSPLGDHMAHHPCIVPRIPFPLTQAGTKTDCIGGHASARPPTLQPRFAPLHYATRMEARIYACVVGPRISGDKQKPHPKGVRAAWRLVVKP